MHKVRVRGTVKVEVQLRVRIAFSSSYPGKGSPQEGYSDPLLDLGYELH